MEKRYKISKEKGLSSREAQSRLRRFGHNVVFRKKRLRPFVAFMKKFNSPLLLMLIGAALVSLFLGQTINAVIILVMVLVSTVLDFLNTYKSEKISEKLLAKVAITATVLRDGLRQEIVFKNIVPGDIVYLSAGDVVPADCHVLQADDFFLNQSALTGESYPVEKSGLKEEKDGEFVFMGTSVITGYGTVLVVRTGEDAEFGKITKSLASVETHTDFEIGIRKFSFFIMRITFVLVSLVFFFNALFGRGILDSFIFAVAIAVGLTPELLPMIMSVALSHGSKVMSQKGVVVKNLSSIQNFGGMNIFCSDKTGTLTEDKITLVKCVDRFGVDSEKVFENAYLGSFFHTSKKGPLDAAIMEHRRIDMGAYKKIDEIPFDFSRKRDSIVAEKGSRRFMVAKGAPEDILKACDFINEKTGNLKINENIKNGVLAEFDRLSADGFRVLAVATKELSHESRRVYEKSEENGMIFLGFAAFLDPPKKTAAETVKELKALNVEMKILTGDSEVLTQRICRDINLEIKGTLTGSEIDRYSDSELERVVLKTTIFARVTPDEKERIILALRRAGNSVGYLGDGINDAPALKAADVGISVNNAIDVAKETADIILLRKSLRVLKDGIIEGRRTFENTLKYIKMGFSSNFGNMFSMMAATFFLPFLPMLPSQILFNNFLYDVSQMGLPADKVDEDFLKKPLRWNIGYLRNYMLVFGAVSSIFDFLTFFMLFKIFHLFGSAFQTGWFIESITTQVLVVYVIRTRKVPFFKSWPSKLLFITTIAAVLIAWLAPFSPVAHFFGFIRLAPEILLVIFAVVAGYLVLVEIVKWLFYKLYSIENKG